MEPSVLDSMTATTGRRTLEPEGQVPPAVGPRASAIPEQDSSQRALAVFMQPQHSKKKRRRKKGGRSYERGINIVQRPEPYPTSTYEKPSPHHQRTPDSNETSEAPTISPVPVNPVPDLENQINNFDILQPSVKIPKEKKRRRRKKRKATQMRYDSKGNVIPGDVPPHNGTTRMVSLHLSNVISKYVTPIFIPKNRKTNLPENLELQSVEEEIEKVDLSDVKLLSPPAKRMFSPRLNIPTFDIRTLASRRILPTSPFTSRKSNVRLTALEEGRPVSVPPSTQDELEGDLEKGSNCFFRCFLFIFFLAAVAVAVVLVVLFVL